ncbi:MAG: hypothetical protein ACM3RX_10520, partial [Methanococcaceae archaeon]
MKNSENYNQINVILKSNVKDIRGEQLETRIKKYLRINTGKITTAKTFIIDYKLSKQDLEFFAQEGLADKVINDIVIGNDWKPSGMNSYVVVSKKPGVTDDEGMSSQKTLFDIINYSGEINRLHIFTS